jgi:hypothetical protein
MIKRLLVVILVLTSVTISAQRNNSSPYSFFGIGEDFKPKTVEQASMGGIGVAMPDYNHLNFVNPAAVADLRYATYGLGGMASFLTLKEADASQSGNSTSLRYIALGFPIGKKAGFSAGLQPLSSVGYSLINEIVDTDDTVLELTRNSGTGGTNRLYANYGMYVFDGLSLGLEAAFIFGNIDKSVLNQRVGVATITKYQEETTVRSNEFKLGVQYKTKLNNDLQLSSGIAMKLANDLTQRGSQRLYNLSFSSSGAEIPRDTLYNRPFSTDLNSPLQTTVGFGVGKENKWYVGINSEFQNAFELNETVAQNNYAYENATRTSIGGYYIPKINSISSYWNRITYRAGLRFERTGLLVNTGGASGDNFTSIKDFGINVGLGLPLPRQLSSLNVGLEYGQKGTTNNNLIKENYFNVRLSLSLNSLNWFQKREID